MVECIENIAEWPTQGLTNLVAQVELAREESKYLFIWDKNGNCPRFFEYKGQLVDFAP